jgi:hypothetical protein
MQLFGGYDRDSLKERLEKSGVDFVDLMDEDWCDEYRSVLVGATIVDSDDGLQEIDVDFDAVQRTAREVGQRFGLSNPKLFTGEYEW